MPSLTPPIHMGRRQPKRLGRRGRWIKRVVALMVLAAGVAETASLWRSGDLPDRLARAKATAIVLAAEAGFRVEEVDVMGRDHTDARTLLAAAGLKRGDPIFSFDPEEARERIESLPWVASAAVERRLPNDVTITLVERQPVALWQHNEHISLVAADGANLGAAAIEAYPDLPLVVGGDAPADASELLRLLAAYPEIAKRIQSSSWIGSRRWTLKMDNGVEVMLPEDGLADAIQQLADAEASTRLLERDVAAVDLRLPGKMIVRLAHEPVAPKPVKPQQGI